MDVRKRMTAIDLSELPLELIIKILSTVPAKPLIHLKCVCKSWYTLINTPNFIKLYVSQFVQANSNKTLIIHAGSSLYTFQFQGPHCRANELHNPEYINLRQRDISANLRQRDIFANLCQSDRFANRHLCDKVVGSCNGLLCCISDSYYSFYQLYLYNPLTRFHKILPRFDSNIMFPDCNLCIDRVGFAYDSRSDDYKVLICMKWQIIYWTSVLYSCKTNAWEIIANPSWGWDSVKFPGVVVSNSLHWMDCDLKQIKCFDLATRHYSEISLPKKVIPGCKPTLADLRQQLCVVTYYLDIWILKEYGVEESWIRIFRCSIMEWNNIYECTPLSRWGKDLSLLCSEDGCKILVATSIGRINFICCDLVSHEVRKIEVEGLPSMLSSVMSWVPSLAAA